MHVWTREQQPETGGGKDREKDGSNTSAAPDAENKDGTDSFPPEVWMTRAGGGMQKRLSAHATLAERVRRGNDLVGEMRETLLLEYCNSPAMRTS